jgi:predicted transcriptional regulator
VAAGESNRQIARRLGLSPHTVERHVANLYRKIGARGRADATAYALRSGLASTRATMRKIIEQRDSDAGATVRR